MRNKIFAALGIVVSLLFLASFMWTGKILGSGVSQHQAEIVQEYADLAASTEIIESENLNIPAGSTLLTLEIGIILILGLSISLVAIVILRFRQFMILGDGSD